MADPTVGCIRVCSSLLLLLLRLLLLLLLFVMLAVVGMLDVLRIQPENEDLSVFDQKKRR
jgi:hypothetical protein